MTVRAVRPSKKVFALNNGYECFARISTKNKAKTVSGIVLKSGVKSGHRHYSRMRIKEIFILK